MNAAQPDVVYRMRSYYAQRAATYETVYHKPERQSDLRAMEAALPGLFAGRNVLEVACGTGWWTAHGARDAAAWLATDLNPETMALAQAKTLPACVRFATVDAYGWQGLQAAPYTAAFAGFWWSHVPLQRLPAWLHSLHAQLASGARVAFLDNRFVPASSLPITHRDAEGNSYQTRTLPDGSVHNVLKNFPTREVAFAAIGARAQKNPQWTAYDHYWLLSYDLD